MSYRLEGDLGPPFPLYPAPPASVVESAAGILLAAGEVDRERQTLRTEARRTQSEVHGEIEIPLAQAPLPASMSADQIILNARFTAGALSRFAEAIGDYDSGVGGLNQTWADTPSQIPPEDREAVRRGLIADRATLEATLDGEAGAVAAMLERGPNDADIRALEAAGLMPSADLQLGSGVESPVVVKVGDEYVVMGSDEDEHVQVVPNDDGSFTIRVGTLVDGELEYRSERIPPGQDGLTIRTYGGNDVIEVPPEVSLNIRAYAGGGNDNYFGGGHPGMSVSGSGDDLIDLGAGDDVAFGGAGDDTIVGGDGEDVIDGQDGWDSVEGGGDFDTIYGGRGYDTVDGGAGDDYLEGGSGNDVVHGGAGNDSMSGGRDEDLLDGDEGDDTMLGGRGTDVFDGDAGYDHVVRERDEAYTDSETSTSFELVGSPGADAIELYQPEWMSDEQYAAWQERIDSDLELIRATPSGREGLEALDDAAADSDSGWNPFDGDSNIRIAPYVGDDQQANDGYSVRDWMREGGWDGNHSSSSGSGDDVILDYNAGNSDVLGEEVPPAVVLYHELAHSHDQISGGSPDGEFTVQVVNECGVIDEWTAPNAEVNAVGFDLDGDGDVDPLDSEGGRDHPGAFTENALRDDLGWDTRDLRPEGDGDVVVIIEDDDGDEHRVTIPD